MYSLEFIKRHRGHALASLAVLIVFVLALIARLLNVSITKPVPTVNKIGALPYFDWVTPSVEDRKKKGVTLNLDGAMAGLNLLVYQSHPQIYLVENSGKIVHSWKAGPHTWFHAELLPGGNLLVLSEKDDLVQKLDWDSKVVWSLRRQVHHSVVRSDSGDVYVLGMAEVALPRFMSHKRASLDNLVLVLSSEGVVKKELALSKLLLESDIPLEKMRAAIAKNDTDDAAYPDPFHANTIEVIRRDVFKGTVKLFKRGDLLVCIRNLNLIVAVDLDRERIVWFWGMKHLDRPHHPSLLKSGNILIFDNGSFRKYSRVVELDPRTGTIAWQYVTTPRDSFYSNTSGSCQRLPNGNTLITDSLRGRVFEVAPRGDLVWEFFSEVKGEGILRKAIWRMTRISDSARLAELGGLMAKAR